MPNSVVTAATTATPIPGTLGRHRRGGITFSLPDTAAAAVYVSDSPSLTTSNGTVIYPGSERSYQGAAAKRDFWCLVASGTQDLRVEETAKK